MHWFTAILAFALLLPTFTHAKTESTRPNIVMIISDDHGWTDYGFMGHPEIRTPNLDRLAAQSLTFKRGYVPSSLCCPSLASILTGQYPQKHKVTSNDPPLPANLPRKEANKTEAFLQGREKMNRFIEEMPTLPKVLGEQGYLSFQAGKWWQGNFRRGGFTHGMTTGAPEKGGRHGDVGLEIGRKTMQPIYDFMDEAQSAKKPFFVWYAPMMPHLPHNPPQRLIEKYKAKAPTERVARYWAMVDWFDETCGELLGELDRRGLAENTIVVYITDNGWLQDPDKADYLLKSKQSQYDGGLRTPIMLRWPGKVKPQYSPDLADSIDLMPTLLKASGAKVPKNLPGIDLFDGKAVRKRETLYGACFTHNSVDLDAPEKSVRWRWCIDGDWKLIMPDQTNEPNAVVELYNLKSDPHEERNLATSVEKHRVPKLARKLDKWWAASLD